MGVPLALALFLFWQLLYRADGLYLVSGMVALLLFLRLNGGASARRLILVAASGILLWGITNWRGNALLDAEQGEENAAAGLILPTHWGQPRQRMLNVDRVRQGRWGTSIQATGGDGVCVRLQQIKQPLVPGDRLVGMMQLRSTSDRSGCSVEKWLSGSIITGWRHRWWFRALEVAGPRIGGLALAITTGDRSQLQTELDQEFRARGLSHLLAVSGLHFGLVALFAWWLSGILMIPAWHRENRNSSLLSASRVAVMLILLTGYAALAGWPDSVLRAWCLIAFWLVWRQWGQFRVHPLAIMGWLGLLLALVQAERFEGLGMQLSYWIVAALMGGGWLLRKSVFGGKYREYAAREKFVGILRLIWFAVAPTAVAAVIGAGKGMAAAWHAIPNNLFAIPWFASVLLPTAWLQLLASFSGGTMLARLGADFFDWSLSWMILVTIPRTQTAETDSLVVAWYGLLSLLLLAAWYNRSPGETPGKS